MRKILSVLLVLCMIMTCIPMAAITSFAEGLDIPVIEEVSEDELVEFFGEGEIELYALADLTPADGDGVTYFTEVEGESAIATGKKGEGDTSLASFFDGKYTTEANENLGTTGFMGYCKDADPANNTIVTIDLGAVRTLSGLRIYDSCRAKYHNNRIIKSFYIF